MRTSIAMVVLGLVTAGCGSNSPGSQGQGGADGGAGPSVDGGGAGAPDSGGGGTGPDAGTAVSDPGSPGPSDWDPSSESIDVGGQTIPLTIYVPRTPGPHPAIVFTHGFMLAPSDYASYGEHLASWDYVVVMPKLPGDVLSQQTHRALADMLVGVLDWIDTAAADQGGPLGGKVDTARIGMAGHSMGGKLSLLVAAGDDRPKAVFGVNPVDTGSPLGGSPADYPSVTPELMPQITAPLALLGETTNGSAGGLGQACAPADNNFQQYYAAAASPAIQIEVVGANHMSFLDDPNCGFTCSVCSAGTDDPSVTRMLTQRYMTAFFETRLRGDSRYQVYLTGAPMQADINAGKVKVEHKNGF